MRDLINMDTSCEESKQEKPS